MKKEFECPELVILYFSNDDIITGSDPTNPLDPEHGDDWSFEP